MPALSCRESIDAIFEEEVCKKCGKALVPQAHAQSVSRPVPLVHKDTGSTACGEFKYRYVPRTTTLDSDKYTGAPTDADRNR